MSENRLTADDVVDCLDDERHLCWGLATYEDLPEYKKTALMKAVVRQANQLPITKEQLFHWTNSKYARWLVDEVESGKLPSEAIQNYMTLRQVMEVQA